MTYPGIVIIMGVTLLFGGCAVVPKGGGTTASYDFGLPAARLISESNPLRIGLEVKAPATFDSLGVDYRLGYDEPLRTREYAVSRWSANPGVLLAQSLRQQLGVIDAAAIDCVLSVELHEFSQVFEAPQLSFGVLAGQLRFYGAKRQTLAERPLLLREAAPTPDARGGVKALVGTAQLLGRDVANWLQELERRGELGICRDVKK